MTLVPRFYQREAVDDCWAYIAQGNDSALLVEPTGSGKAYIIALMCQEAFGFDPTARVLVLTDSAELVEQNYLEFTGIWPEAPAGLYCAGLKRKEMSAQFLFGSIQSIWRHAYKVQKCDILFVDEVHMISKKQDAMYGEFIKNLRIINPNLVVIGLTATPWRTDQGKVYGDGQLFKGIAHETSPRLLIDEGYLTAPQTWNPRTLDTSKVKVSAGDFMPSGLEKEAMDPEMINAVVDATIDAGDGIEGGWKVFGCTVAHCEALHEEFQRRGYVGSCVFGESSDRREVIADFRSRKLQYLISNMALIKGFNVKHIAVLTLAFATQSLTKYIQAVGRGTRPLYASGFDLETREGRLAAIEAGPKPVLRVVDFGANISRLGPFDAPFVPSDKKEKDGEPGDPLVKYCPECEQDCHVATRVCGTCGFEFPPIVRKIFDAPSAADILSRPPEWLDVEDIKFSLHEKPGKPVSLKVSYRTGLVTHHEWVCLSHEGYARTKAESWWMRHADAPVPATAVEAMMRQRQIRGPDQIRVKKNGKFTEVIGHRHLALAQPRHDTP